MKLTLKRCHTCHALGVGPNKVDLWPFEGRLYCKEDYKLALTWEESRDGVTMGIDNLYEYQRAAIRLMRKTGYLEVTWKAKPGVKWDWRFYIEDLCGIAGWAMEVGDRRTFVHYASRAVWAWALKEERE